MSSSIDITNIDKLKETTQINITKLIKVLDFIKKQYDNILILFKKQREELTNKDVINEKIRKYTIIKNNTEKYIQEIESYDISNYNNDTYENIKELIKNIRSKHSGSILGIFKYLKKTNKISEEREKKIIDNYYKIIKKL